MPKSDKEVKALSKCDFDLSQTLVETMIPNTQEYTKNQIFYCQTQGETYVTVLGHDKDTNTCVCRLKKKSSETQDCTLKTDELQTTIKIIVKTATVQSEVPSIAEVQVDINSKIFETIQSFSAVAFGKEGNLIY